MKGYKERGRSRGEANNGWERVKGWEERIFAVLFCGWQVEDSGERQHYFSGLMRRL
jgi:hypothetical protein